MNARENPKSLKEALTMFQEMNVTATKNTSNEYFKSTYSDLTSVITAVNHGAEFGLSFSQSVEYKNIILERVKTENGANVKYQELHRDIFVKTIVSHIQDKETLECTVPVLVNEKDKNNCHALGSAITYAKRYGLQSLYGLASDDDGNSAVGLVARNSDKPKVVQTEPKQIIKESKLDI